jgi:hypothetical protein
MANFLMASLQSKLFFAKCFFIELLELDPEVKMITPNDSTSSIEQESLISLVLKKLENFRENFGWFPGSITGNSNLSSPDSSQA